MTRNGRLASSDNAYGRMRFSGREKEYTLRFVEMVALTVAFQYESG
jgi:hypothetical protein